MLPVAVLLAPAPRRHRVHVHRVHVHRFRHRFDDPLSGTVFYGCRCGSERPAL